MHRYIVAIYLRLSVDDKRVESMSIESQRLLLRKYAEILGDNVEILLVLRSLRCFCLYRLL